MWCTAVFKLAISELSLFTTCQNLYDHYIISKLTSDCYFRDHFAVGHFVAGHALVAPSILSSSQVDLKIPSANLGPLGQVSIQFGPSVGQGRSAVGQALQPDHLPDPNSHIVGHRSGIRRG